MHWISAFWDLPEPVFPAGSSYWSAATGYPLSGGRGPAAEFVSLVPEQGDEYLKVQRIGSDIPGVHLDLHVADPRAEAHRATELGATVLTEHPTYVVLTSPGAMTFCFVDNAGSHIPSAATWGEHHASKVDQVCLDIPSASYDTEVRFWSQLLDAESRPGQQHPEFQRIAKSGWPLALLLQRLKEPTGDTRAHIDLACDDRQAEVERLIALGAQLVNDGEFWTVLLDPAGQEYCVTARDPRTGTQ